MARTKTNSDVAKNLNEVLISGKIKKILVDNDKVVKFTLDSVSKSPNGKDIHTFISIVCFNDVNADIKEGNAVVVKGSLMTSSYRGNFRVDVVAETIDDYTN